MLEEEPLIDRVGNAWIRPIGGAEHVDMAGLEPARVDLVRRAAQLGENDAAIEDAAGVVGEPPPVAPQADHTDGQDKDVGRRVEDIRSEEHTSELQSLMRISYAV